MAYANFNSEHFIPNDFSIYNTYLSKYPRVPKLQNSLDRPIYLSSQLDIYWGVTEILLAQVDLLTTVYIYIYIYIYIKPVYMPM